MGETMLTEIEIKKAIRAATAERVLNDHAASRGAGSLRLRIRPNATGACATWLVYWKSGGARATKPLGRYPEMSVTEARRVYMAEIVPSLLLGKDPRSMPSDAKRPTVERLFQSYVDALRAQGKSSADEVERALLRSKESAANALGRHKLARSISPNDIANYLAVFYQRGNKSTADKARSYIKTAFQWGINSANDYTAAERVDWQLSSNPAGAVPRDKDATGTRDRALSADEIRSLWRAATPGQNGFTLETAACIRLLIATGQRVQETLRLDGAELDLDAAVWSMPAEKTKLGLRPHKIPLPRQVLPILRDLVALNGAGPLFPARSDSKNDRIDHRSIKQAIDRWLKRSGDKVAPFQTRDLRRTWKSRAGEVGLSREMRDLIQQHGRTDTGSRHYDIADYLPQMRAAMDQWADWLGKVIGPDESPAFDFIS